MSTENYNPKTAVPEYGSNIKKTGQTLISLEDCKLRLAKTKYEYNGKARTPAVEVSYQGKKVDASTYKVTYKNNKNSGAAVALVEGLEEKGYTGSVSLSFTIEKQVNTITCSASSFQRETASKKTSFSIGAKVKRGALSYKSNHAKVSINAKGMVTISPHFVGTVKIEIQSKEFANYKSAKKTITLQVNPKKSVKLSA